MDGIMPTVAGVTAEFMTLFEKLHDEGEDEDEEPPAASNKKAKKTAIINNDNDDAVLGPDDAVAISLAAAEYYLNKNIEWGACDMMEGFRDFSCLIYAKAKEFKAKYHELFDAAAVAKAIRSKI